jgi:broad specificity phosphatase PhoE
MPNRPPAFDPDRRKWAVATTGALLAPSLVIPASGAMGSPGANDAALVKTLRQGGCVVLVRHAVTVPGLGDPPGMQLNDCSTQRDLSEEGRRQSRAMGRWFRSHGLVPEAVRSSQWCRCLNTAKEAFGPFNFDPPIPVQPWVALNSFFQGHGNRDRQLKEAAERAITLRRSKGFEVWVTHQVVISTLAGRYTSMGEMLAAKGEHPYPSPLSDRSMQVLSAGVVF